MLNSTKALGHYAEDMLNYAKELELGLGWFLG